MFFFQVKSYQPVQPVYYGWFLHDVDSEEICSIGQTWLEQALGVKDFMQEYFQAFQVNSCEGMSVFLLVYGSQCKEQADVTSDTNPAMATKNKSTIGGQERVTTRKQKEHAISCTNFRQCTRYKWNNTGTWKREISDSLLFKKWIFNFRDFIPPNHTCDYLLCGVLLNYGRTMNGQFLTERILNDFLKGEIKQKILSETEK